eukprot:s4123_g4.t1
MDLFSGPQHASCLSQFCSQFPSLACGSSRDVSFFSTTRRSPQLNEVQDVGRAQHLQRFADLSRRDSVQCGGEATREFLEARGIPTPPATLQCLPWNGGRLSCLRDFVEMKRYEVKPT